MTDREIIQQKLDAMERQEMALAQQADAILEQLTMTKGAVQILQQVLRDMDLQTAHHEAEIQED